MPCHDPKRAKLFSKERNYYRERHCPSFEEKLRCLIPPPSDYQIPVRWPESLQKVSIPLLCFVFFFCIQVSSHCAHSLWGEEEGVKLIFIKKKLNLWIIFFTPFLSDMVQQYTACQDSNTQIRSRLDGSRGRLFCLPWWWYFISRRSRRLYWEAGKVHSFWNQFCAHGAWYRLWGTVIPCSSTLNLN